MRIGDQYSSESVTPKDFEKLAEDAGLGKPLVKRRVSELAEVLLVKLPLIDAGNPVAREGRLNSPAPRGSRNDELCSLTSSGNSGPKPSAERL